MNSSREHGSDPWSTYPNSGQQNVQYHQPNLMRLQQPGHRQPPSTMYQQPAYQQPAYEQPTYQQPAYQQPAYQQVAFPQQQMAPVKARQRVAPRPPKPQFVQKLTDVRIKEGEPLVLAAWVQADNPPKIKWYLDDKKVAASGRIICQVESNGRCTFRVNEATLKDAGFYTIRASNTHGWDSCSALVSIETKGEVDTESFVSKDTLKQLNYLRRDRSRKHQDDDGVEDKLVKPGFRQRPADVEAKEGSLVRLNCMVGGRPPPDVSWFKDGMLVFDDERHKILVNEGGVHSLMFTSVSPDDEGQYTCIARNKGGEAKCNVRLGVRQEQYKCAPRFLNRIQAVNVCAGETVVLDTEAEGQPQPMLSWQKDGKNLHGDNRRIFIDTQGATSRLSISAVDRVDSGWYQCTASNIAGTASTRAKLTVQADFHGLPRGGPTDFKLVIKKSNRSIEPVQIETVPSWVSRARREETPESDLYSRNNPQPPSLKRPVKPTPNPPIPLNEPVKLHTRVLPVGDPMMHITWYKDGFPLPDVVRYRTSFDRGHANLMIDYFTPEDQGTYYLVVQNMIGYCESNRVDMRASGSSSFAESGPDDMPSRPMIMRPPEPISVDEGEPAKFVARVAGQPLPEVTWFMNGDEARHGNRIQIHFDGLVHTLEVYSCTAEDNGKVELVAHNSMGMDRAETALNVLSRGPQWAETALNVMSRGPQWAVNLKKIKMKPSEVTLQMAQPGPGHAPVTMGSRAAHIDGQAPVFVAPLQAVRVREGDPARLEVEFQGFPIPQIFWFREGAEIRSSTDFQIQTTDRRSVLTIPEAFVEDAGSFAVRATNELGTANCNGSLAIMKAEQDSPPQVIRPLANTTVNEGSSGKFVLEVTGRPLPQVTWFKDGDDLTNNPDYKLSASGFVHTLHIPEVFMDDAGEYSVRIWNQLGQVLSSGKLVVKEVPVGGKVEAPGPGVPPVKKEVPPVKKETPQPRNPPVISKQLTPQIKIVKDKDIRLECAATGTPMPVFSWYRNGKVLQASAKYAVTTTEAGSTLIIKAATSEDAGEYIFKAENDFGVITSKTTLQSGDENPPSIVDELSNKTVPDGSEVTFICKVDGSRPLKISWFRGDKAVTASPEFKISFEEGTGTATLKLSEVFPEDAGLYRCVVENTMGKAESKAKLTVATSESEPEEGVKVEEEKENKEDQEGQDAEEEFTFTLEEEEVVEEAVQLKFTTELPGEMKKSSGEDVRLECIAEGAKPVAVSWTLNGKKLEESDRLEIGSVEEKGTFFLQIKKCNKDDGGEYVCTASNKDGKIETKTKVVVEEPKKTEKKEESKEDKKSTSTTSDKKTEETKDDKTAKTEKKEDKKDDKASTKEAKKDENDLNKTAKKDEKADSKDKKNEKKDSKAVDKKEAANGEVKRDDKAGSKKEDTKTDDKPATKTTTAKK